MRQKIHKVNHNSRLYESSISIDPSVEPNTSPKSRVSPLIIILVLVISGSLYYYLKTSYPTLFQSFSPNITILQESPTPSETTTNSAINTPTPIPYTLPSGEQKYSFNHGANVKGPKPTSITIDPLDPKIGDTQTLTLELSSDSPIISTMLSIITDNNQKNLTLQKISGDELNGTYKTSWQVDDPYENKYAFNYLFKSNTGTFDNTMYIRR